jgi:hypothetical protein
MVETGSGDAMKKTAPLALAAALTLLCGCRQNPSPASDPATAASTPITAAGPIYSDSRQGFAIAIPTGMQLRHDFRRSYLGGASWKAFAGPDDHGTPAVALVLDGSNRITAAELRIGIGTGSGALAHCRDLPASGAAPASDTTTLAGAPAIHFHAADAAMSHYLDVDSYRVVHAGRCYAIDLLLTGTRPEVYDPPATPPFARADAQRQLHEALNGFRFLP